MEKVLSTKMYSLVKILLIYQKWNKTIECKEISGIEMYTPEH